jgi:hypothetical protein
MARMAVGIAARMAVVMGWHWHRLAGRAEVYSVGSIDSASPYRAFR